MRDIRNANVCVVGGAGFLGSHLVDHLIEDRNCTVLVLDNLISGHKKFINPKAIFEWCDITRSESEIRRLFEKYKIEYVFNYAAMPYIPFSFARPIHTFDVNAVGALKVINAAQDAGVKGILQVSSAEIYGDAPDYKIDETYPANPHSTYGAAKLAIDTLVQARWKENQTHCIALRQFNCYGERETHPYVIPEIINQLTLAEVKQQSLGDKLGTINYRDIYLGNNSFRDFQYAGDAVRMAVELLEKGEFGEVYNMGSEEGIKIYDLAEKLIQIMEIPTIVIQTDPLKIRPWEIWHLQSDNTKLYSVIDYRPQMDFAEGLKRTIQDFKDNGWVYET